MDMINYNPAPKSLLMAYSQEFGIELFSLKSGGFDRFDFESFLEDLKKDTGEQKVTLFMDNLRMHKCPLVRAAYERLGFPVIFNIPYQPNDNPIERIFGKIKREFGKRRVSYQDFEQRPDRENLIK